MRVKNVINAMLNGTIFLQAPLKAYELDERILKEKYGLIVYQLDYSKDADIEIWKSIIHTSYDDCHYTTESARALLTNHPYMEDTQTFVFQPVSVSGGGIATVSIGKYRNNPLIGGDFRIGVTKTSQGKGYGRLCVLYAFSKLASMGVKFGESAIMFKRKESLYLHYALGFHPQNNTKYLADPNLHPWMKNLNFILRIRINRSYHSFLKNERIKYLNK